MIDHDKNVGQMLDLLDELGHRRRHDRHVHHRQRAAHEHLARRRDDAVPQREEHQLGRRVPRARAWCAGRARSQPGTVSNEIVSHHDWLPTFLAAAGEPTSRRSCSQGHQAGGKTFKVHLDGYNLLPYLTGKERRARARASSTSTTTATWSRCATTTGRWCSWSSAGAARSRSGPSRSLRAALPKLFNLRTDPFERADVTSNTYWDWYLRKAYLILAAQALVARFLDVQGVPAAPEGRELHHRPGDGEDGGLAQRAVDGVAYLNA